MNAEDKDSNGLMTVPEVAKYLGYSEGTIYQKVSRGEIPFVKLGHALRFRRSELDAWIAEKDAEAKSEPSPST